MSLGVASIETALYAWVFGELDILTIFSHQNAPRPTGQYALIQLSESTPIGHGGSRGERQLDDSVVIEYSLLYQLMVSINVFRGDSSTKISQLRDSLLKITVRDDLTDADLGFNNSSAMRNIPDAIDKLWEQREQMDFFFYTRSITSETINEIKKIELTNQLDSSTTLIQDPSI